MSDKNKTKQKSSKWFTKKEITTPLQILNKLLDLPLDKQLKFNPLAMSPDKEKQEKEKKEKRDKKEKQEVEKEKGEKDKRGKEFESRQQQKPTTSPDSTNDINISIDFQDIDQENQKYLNKIIPQLNEIYNLINLTDQSDVQPNEVIITREGIDSAEPNKRVIEEKISIFVPKYIPPIET